MKIIRLREISGMTEPAIDVIPESAIQKTGKPFFLPDFSESFRCRAAVGIRICRLGKNIAAKFASRYYEEAGICLTIEASDLLEKLKAAHAPWALATAFDGAVIVGSFCKENKDLLENELPVTFSTNGIKIEQVSSPKIPDFDTMIAYVSQFFTLKMGDCLLIERGDFHKLSLDDHIAVKLGNYASLNIKIK